MAGEKQLRYHSKREAGCCTELFRGILMIVNIVLALAALALVGLGIWTDVVSNKEVTKVCHTCGSVTIGGIVLFVTLAIFAIIGFCALWRRNLSLLLVYGFYLVLFLLGALAITIVFVLVKEGHFDSTFNDIWTSSVTKQENLLCGFETDLQCSGWTSLCNQTTPYNVTNPDNTTNTLCPICTSDQQTQIATYNTTCHDALNSDIDQYFTPIVAVGFSLVGLSLISIIVACKVRGDGDDDDEGSYQRV